MTKLLLRLFVKEYDTPKKPKVRAAVGKLSGVVGIVCNGILFGLKLLVGTVSGSVSITADAMNNLSDAASAIVTLVGFKLAEKPADEDHPYGHARYEYLAALVVAALILVIGFELAVTSVKKILSPAPVELTVPMAAALAGAGGIKLWVDFFNRKLGRQINSKVLLATAADSLSDVEIKEGMVVFFRLVIE